MLVTVSNVLTVDNPTDELLFWCNKNLVLANPEYLRRMRMNLYLDNTPKNLTLYEVRGKQLILPYGVLTRIPKATYYIPDFKAAVNVDYGEKISLYPYQEKAVQAMIAAQYGILQSPAGSGKTAMAMALISRLKRRTLWLCHTKDLIQQSMQRAANFLVDSKAGTIMEGKVQLGEGITFATVQTMCNLDLAQYRNYWDCIIVDECHRVAFSPTSVTMYSKVLNALAARHKYGLTATPHRSDGMIQATYALLGEVAYRVPDEEVKDKIMQVTIYPVATGIGNTRQCLNTDGTLNYARWQTYLGKNLERNRIIAEHIRQRPSLILSTRLSQLEILMTCLPPDMREQAVMINGKMTTKEQKQRREQALEDMRTGRKMYLFATYSLCREGLDIPCLEDLHLAAPAKDPAVIEQSIGRVDRICDGKQNPVVFDYVDNSPEAQKYYKKRCTTYRKCRCYIT